jgi:hypothetical protein
MAGSPIDIVCSRCGDLWPCETYNLRRLLNEIHEAIGEDANSDDASLPGVISLMLGEMRERIKFLEKADGDDWCSV